MAHVLYVLQPIGVNNALEAIDTLWFCCEGCRTVVRENTEHVVRDGMNSDFIPGTVCDECGNLLTA